MERTIEPSFGSNSHAGLRCSLSQVLVFADTLVFHLDAFIDTFTL